MTANRTQAFLAALDRAEAPPAAAAKVRVVDTTKRAEARTPKKHIGGYFEDDDVMKFTMLKARLKLDNSELIKRAIDELHTREMARLAFEG